MHTPKAAEPVVSVDEPQAFSNLVFLLSSVLHSIMRQSQTLASKLSVCLRRRRNKTYREKPEMSGDQ